MDAALVQHTSVRDEALRILLRQRFRSIGRNPSRLIFAE